jgi:hypothetical protein
VTYPANVVRVIASPSDVPRERDVAVEILHEWNAINSQARGIVLLPVRWETHAAPALGDRPQALINKQVLKDCDILVAIFWTRLGSPTGAAPSGTVEEIREHSKASKRAMLYFSTMPAQPDSIDPEQYKALVEFRGQARGLGLVETFESPADFGNKFRVQLAHVLLESFSAPSPSITPIPIPISGAAGSQKRTLGQAAMELLVEAAKDSEGEISRLPHLNGTLLETNGRDFGKDADARTLAKWEAGLRELVTAGMLHQRIGQHGDFFRVTHAGYQFAEQLGKSR